MAVQTYPGVTVAQGLRGASRGPERVSRAPYGMEHYPGPRQTVSRQAPRLSLAGAVNN